MCMYLQAVCICKLIDRGECQEYKNPADGIHENSSSEWILSLLFLVFVFYLGD